MRKVDELVEAGATVLRMLQQYDDTFPYAEMEGDDETATAYREFLVSINGRSDLELHEVERLVELYGSMKDIILDYKRSTTKYEQTIRADVVDSVLGRMDLKVSAFTTGDSN